jgi:serine/threonine protein kinase
MYCPDCGYLNRPGAKYCATCQAPLGVAAASWRGPLRPDDLMDNGRYRILRPLGKGGMGAVYVAENLQAFGREVVIKEMLDYFDPNNPGEAERARQRFEDEARTLAALKHPSVPDIYGYFSQGGRNYLVMEYVLGENLEAGVTHRDGDGNLVPALPYTQTQIIHCGVQLCDLLNYLAGRQDPTTGEIVPVIHSDIKPANIIRDPHTERVWLVDFGTAKTRFQQPANQQPSAGQESAYGTVGYAPPEQYHGQSDPRSDVYALAATLYHLLTDDDPRDHPFEFDQLTTLPAELRLALSAALAIDVNQRSTAAQLKAALTQAMPDQPNAEVKPLAYPDGKVAEKLSDIPRLALSYWDYTRDTLQAGDLEYWLRRSLHNPVAAETAKRVVSAYADQDEALDGFLRELDPDFPRGKLELPRDKIDLGMVTTGRGATATIELRNNGRGFSHGEVTSSAGWLAEVDGRYRAKPGGSDQLVIQADTSQLEPGKRYSEALVITPADGSEPLKLEVTLAVAEPRVNLLPERLTFDIRGGTIGPQEIELSNTGANQVGCAITRDEQWLLVSPRSLTLPPGQSARATVTIREDRLPPIPRPRATLTINPDHGSVMTIPVNVLAGRRSILGRTVIAMLALGALGLLAWGSISWFGGGGLGSILPAADTPVPLTAESLDAAMVRVDGLEVDQYEVTNLQYARYAPDHAYEPGEELMPAVNVSWAEAQGYCEWVGKALPSQEEWRLAAAGEEGWTYPWGNEADPSRVNSENNRQTNGLLPVDALPEGSTPEGITQMLGNASEWVVGPADHAQTHCGGSWQDFGLTTSRCFWATGPDAEADTIGFRCARPLEAGN